MDKQLISFPSVTFAMKARDILKKNGVLSVLERTPMNLKYTSCGYSLSVPKDIDKAVQLLKKYNIRYLGISKSDAG